jgi:hypothetical protein
MTLDDIRTKWLSPAVDHKEREKRANRSVSDHMLLDFRLSFREIS